MLIAVFLVFLIISPAVTDAVTPEEEYKKIQERILDQKKKLSEAQEKESSVLNELEDVNRKLVKIDTDLRKYRKKLQHTEKGIADVNAELTKTKASLEKQKDWLRRKLKVMHKFGYSGDTMMALLGSEDISQMMRVWKYLESTTRLEHKMLIGYRENIKNYEAQQNKLSVLRAELKRNAEDVKKKENELSEQKHSKENILSSVRHKKAEHQKMLSELNQASKKLLDIIKESTKTDTYTTTSEFSKLKGKLPWPVDGKIAISYGSQRDPQFDTPVFRNGMHFQTDSNENAKSVFSGKIIFAEWFKGFGQLVIVNHGNGYHSLYGNLSEIFSRIGDIIKDKQVIGKVGMSGTLNTYGLYFEIRYKGKPLDPAQWLKKKR